MSSMGLLEIQKERKYLVRSFLGGLLLEYVLRYLQKHPAPQSSVGTLDGHPSTELDWQRLVPTTHPHPVGLRTVNYLYLTWSLLGLVQHWPTQLQQVVQLLQ